MVRSGAMRDYEYLDLSIDDDVLTIAFDRPDVMNAIKSEVHKELTYVFKDAYEADARVVVLTGNGPAFSAGGDLEGMKDDIENPDPTVAPFADSVREGEEIIEDLVNLEKPIVAKVNGDAIGLGATLALFCDIVIASEDARIGDPHISAGLVAGDGGAVIWPLLTNVHFAKEFLMTGDLLTAEEAAEAGLINRAVPAEELDAEVDEMVHKLATGPQLAIQYTKMAINKWVQNGVTDILRESIALEAISSQHPDHEEAVDSFLERRTPHFPSGRDPDREP